MPRLALISTLPLSLALGLVLLASPAQAGLASLDDVRCLCADGALNTGDYVSCVAHFSRRLLASGAISRSERQAAVREASDEDLEALLAGCDDGGMGGDNAIGLEGWGTALSVGSAFYPAPSPSGPAAAAIGKLLLWNFSPQDVFQFTPIRPNGDCAFEIIVRDAGGAIVRRDPDLCLPTTGRLDLPVGTIEEREFLLPLLTLSSERGDPDGLRLGSGVYTVEVTWVGTGPDRNDMPSGPGLSPHAAITIRIGS